MVGFLGAWIQMLYTNYSTPCVVEADTSRYEGDQVEGWYGEQLAVGDRPLQDTPLRGSEASRDGRSQWRQVSLFTICLHSIASGPRFQVSLLTPGCPRARKGRCACPTSNSASWHSSLTWRAVSFLRLLVGV